VSTTSNIALFEAAYQAYVERGDLDVFYWALDPDVEWRAWNDEGNCHGRDEVMAVIRSAFDRGVPVEVPPHVDAGDKLVLMPREMPPFFRPDAEGLFQVVEIRDGTIVAIRDFIHQDDAMAAAGLSSPGGPPTRAATGPVDRVSDPRWSRAAPARKGHSGSSCS
jgi:ketosteroid isomerase-like protein